MRIFALCLLSVALSVAATAASAQEGGRGEAVSFDSVTPSGPGDLMRGIERLPTTAVQGWLSIPARPRPVAAVIIAHGSGGVSAGREFAWADRLGALGLATLVVDSFGPRGIQTTANDQRQLSAMANVADALFALRFLAAEPRIDPSRIAVIGFSRGGQVALYTALEPLRRSVAGESLKFAAHVALYPSCNLPYHGEVVSGARILFALGAEDDYTPPQPCERYAEWFRGKGGAVTTIVYPGAGHGFDSPSPLRFMASAQTARGCNAEFELQLPVLMRRHDTGETLQDAAIGRYLASCMERGAHFGGNAAALERVVADVSEFLRPLLRP